MHWNDLYMITHKTCNNYYMYYIIMNLLDTLQFIIYWSNSYMQDYDNKKSITYSISKYLNQFNSGT